MSKVIAASVTGARTSGNPLAQYAVRWEDSGFDESTKQWHGIRVLEVPNDEVEDARPYFSESVDNKWPGKYGKFDPCIYHCSLRHHPTKDGYTLVTCRYQYPGFDMLAEPGRGIPELSSVSEVKRIWIGMRNTSYMSIFNDPDDYRAGGAPSSKRRMGSSTLFVRDKSQPFPRQRWIIRTVTELADVHLWDWRQREQQCHSNKYRLKNIGRGRNGEREDNAGKYLLWGINVSPRQDNLRWANVTIELLYDEDGWEPTGTYVVRDIRASKEVANPGYDPDNMDSEKTMMKNVKVGAKAVKTPSFEGSSESDIPENGWKAFEDNEDQTIERGKVNMRWVDDLMEWIYDDE